MSTHRCFSILFLDPGAATDDGTTNAGGSNAWILHGYWHRRVVQRSLAGGLRPFGFSVAVMFQPS